MQTSRVVEPLERRTLLALSVQVDYSLDKSDFFASAERRALLQSAFDYVIAHFDDSLAAVVPGGGNTYSFELQNPNDHEESLTIVNRVIPQDTDDVPDVITAPLVASLSVKGAMQVDVAAGVIGKVTVGAALSGAVISADQSIAAVTAGSIVNSSIFAGYQGGLLPQSVGELAGDAAAGEIKAVTVKSKTAGAFSGSRIAAAKLGKVALGTVLADSDGAAPFGVAADVIKSISVATGSAAVVRAKALDDPADSLTVADFVLRLL